MLSTIVAGVPAFCPDFRTLAFEWSALNYLFRISLATPSLTKKASQKSDNLMLTANILVVFFHEFCFETDVLHCRRVAFVKVIISLSSTSRCEIDRRFSDFDIILRGVENYKSSSSPPSLQK